MNGINFINVGGISDPLNNTVLFSGVNSFSRWSFGQVGHKSGDTTRFTTVHQESLNVVAVKIKKKESQLPFLCKRMFEMRRLNCLQNRE
ncbi:MAG: hypothetical protein FJ218_02030 [Ignavibacteria bacterium]|nr:hypothetical protein [Ignavibacteria bacterium]